MRVNFKLVIIPVLLQFSLWFLGSRDLRILCIWACGCLAHLHIWDWLPCARWNMIIPLSVHQGWLEPHGPTQLRYLFCGPCWPSSAPFGKSAGRKLFVMYRLDLWTCSAFKALGAASTSSPSCWSSPWHWAALWGFQRVSPWRSGNYQSAQFSRALWSIQRHRLSWSSQWEPF